MMKLTTTLLYFLIFLSNHAGAHTELSKPAIGFIYLQDFHKGRPNNSFEFGDYDPTGISRGVLLYGEMGSVPLTAFDYIQLKSVYLGKKRQHMAYVFKQRADRYQVRTDESQFLWVEKENTSGYVTIEDLLLDSCVYLDVTIAGEINIASDLNDTLVPLGSWTAVKDERIFEIEELKESDGELWIRISPKWFDQWHSKNNTMKNDVVFNSSRWALVHDIEGLLAFNVFQTGADCE